MARRKKKEDETDWVAPDFDEVAYMRTEIEAARTAVARWWLPNCVERTANAPRTTGSKMTSASYCNKLVCLLGLSTCTAV